MRKVNWGIIGLGNIAEKFAQATLDVKNSNLIAIASKSESKLKNFKKKYKIQDDFAFDDYENLLRCKDIDIVYISLPTSLHYQWIIRCIKNRKKVLVEKPATLNLMQALDIQKHIEETNIFFSEAFMYRYMPHLDQIIKIIKNNEIGNLLSMESVYGVNILTKKKFFFFNKKKKINRDDRKFNIKLGGGCILDLGCYPSSFSLLVASLLKEVDVNNFKLVNIKNEIGETGVEIDSEAEILFNRNFSSKIKASFKKNLGCFSKIIGSKGSLIIKNTWLGGDKIYKITDGQKKTLLNL